VDGQHGYFSGRATAVPMNELPVGPRCLRAVEDAPMELDEDLEWFLVPADRLSSAGWREELHDRPYAQ